MCSACLYVPQCLLQITPGGLFVVKNVLHTATVRTKKKLLIQDRRKWLCKTRVPVFSSSDKHNQRRLSYDVIVKFTMAQQV